MADAAVEFLLGNLKDLLLYHPHVIIDNKKLIESLESDMRIFNAFLKESSLKRRKDESMKVLAREIRDVVYDVEDTIDAFVTQAMERKSSSLFRLWKPSVSLHVIGEKVENVRYKVEQVRFKFYNLSVDEDNDVKPKARPPRMKDMVGFKDVTDKLTKRLTEETDYFDVVCLTGMFGLGKTTLAWKIFNDPTIFYQFPVRIWLPVSEEFSKKDIFLGILKEFTTITAEIRGEDDNKIAQMVTSCLEKGSFLIVFDDVWKTEHWDIIRDALPTNNYKGKVLITSRNTNVGKHACKPRPQEELRFFTEVESWELLRLEALRTLHCPTVLEATGKMIAKECGGLPLAVVIMGGILSTKYWESDLNKTSNSWLKVSKNVNSYITEDPKDRMNSFISLSYDKLPYHLRACFLYLGMFPEDYEIPASKLVRMWIAEGFIQQSTDSHLEETGEKYLEDLINRNLVLVVKINYDGKVKTCRIHSIFHDFCKTEAGSEYENFLQEIKFVDGGSYPPISDLYKYRRLCVHSHFPKFISSRLFGPRVRSFVCFSKDEFILPSENVPDIFNAFKLLRVLDVKPLRFPKLCRQLFQLVHVRYVAISLDVSVLPAKFSELWNLQTLIVDTTSTKLEVKADILKLIQLRHFKTNVSATLPKPSKDSKHGAELLTLGTISVASCTTELSKQACNLKKLGVRGQLELLLEGKKESSFDRLARMKHLENLKLINDGGHLDRLPPPFKFPYRLKRLTLRGTSLEWSNMSTLAMLVVLEVLKLKDKAFVGECWEAVDGGFQRLEFLLINDTDLKVWNASSNHFPRLKRLVLQYCEKLTEIPVRLADIETFNMLELNICPLAAASARKIQEAKKKEMASFKLSFFPPAE